MTDINKTDATSAIKVHKYIELNHIITHGMETYPGLSHVDIYDHLPRFANKALVDGIDLLGISGTYIDSPFHENINGHKICDYPLEKLVHLPIVVINKSDSSRSFEIEDFNGINVNGKAVLLNSKHDQFFGQKQYAENTPYLSVEAANYLVQAGAVLVGIDSPLVDDIETSETAIPVHGILLNNGIVICEDMTNIAAVEGENAYLTAVPPRVALASFPARVFATVFA